MNLISKVKKLSILSVVALNTLLLSGGLTINAMNPQSSNGSTSNVVVPYSKSIIDCVSQSVKQLSVEPIIIFAYNSPLYPKGEMEIGIPQVVFFPNVKKIEVVRQRIVLEGKLVPAGSVDSASNANTLKILAYIPSKERLKGRLFNEPIYIYIPQVGYREGARHWLTLTPQPVNFIGMPISVDNPALKFQKVEQSVPSKIMELYRGPVVENSLMGQLRQFSGLVQKGRIDARANQLQARAVPLNSSGFLPTPSSVEFSNTVSKNQQPSVSENPSPSLPSFSYLLKSQAEQPSVSKNEESNNPSASKSESLIGKCIERHLRFIRDLKNIDSSRKSVISNKSLQTPQPSTPLSSEQTKQTNYVTPERNKLSLQNSVSKSNGVQKTTVQNSQKLIHREAKKPMKTVDDKSPIHINLSDSQSDIETDIDTDIDTDIEENSDYNKK
ncbi:MAG: hypothetical protein ACI4PR_02220 [Acutalibacteraceae bacterium]